MTTDRSLLRAKLAGLLGILLFAGFVLLVVSWENHWYFSRNLPMNDGRMYFLMTGPIVHVGHMSGITKAVELALYRAQTYGQTALPFLLAAILSPFLPMSFNLAVVLNGIGYGVLAVSLYAIFLRIAKTPFRAVLLSLPLLVVTNPLAHPVQGLGDLNLNLFGYLFGVPFLCWVILSDGFQRPWRAFLCGILASCLLLSRMYALAIVLPMSLPYIVSSVWHKNRKERTNALRGLGIALAVLILYAVGGSGRSYWKLSRGSVTFMEKTL